MTRFESAPWPSLDQVTARYLEAHPDVRDRWLLVQTLATAAPRRALLNVLGIEAGWRVLDVGTGFGPVAHELAGGMDARVVGTDIDFEKLEAAQAMGTDLGTVGWPAGTGTAVFAGGDVHCLPFGAATFDAAVVRFLYQHLHDHTEVTSELARVVRPNGVVCIVDVDDSLSITYPEISSAFGRLRDVFTTMQEAGGGDRRVGRKLAGILDAGGFAVTAVLVIPQASYGPSTPEDPGRRFLIERFALARSGAVAQGLIDSETFDALMDDLAAESVPAQTLIEAHVAVVARRR
ncbi:MAG TPA: methyltransferase domain-containing protein [Acidimicrobiales bacterium]|nr:methyltransferase domain-containing protein [Acidimicrobiales bacterium]